MTVILIHSHNYDYHEVIIHPLTRYQDYFYILEYATASVQFCGGSILNESFIITAAHCFTNPDDKIDYKKVIVIAGVLSWTDQTTYARLVCFSLSFTFLILIIWYWKLWHNHTSRRVPDGFSILEAQGNWTIRRYNSPIGPYTFYAWKNYLISVI